MNARLEMLKTLTAYQHLDTCEHVEPADKILIQRSDTYVHDASHRPLNSCEDSEQHAQCSVKEQDLGHVALFRSVNFGSRQELRNAPQKLWR